MSERSIVKGKVKARLMTILSKLQSAKELADSVEPYINTPNLDGMIQDISNSIYCEWEES